MGRQLVFFIGTTAEYIKVFTIIQKCQEMNIPYKIIATGQNEIIETDIAKATNLKIDLQLSSEKSIVKSATGLFCWFVKTISKAKKLIKKEFDDIDYEHSIMVLHGDTVSAVMGAIVAKQLKMKIAHIEAGLRSFHWFSPFPEEIDRCIISKLSNYNFAPGNIPINNLKKAKGKNINTYQNTLIDALAYSEKFECNNLQINELKDSEYAVFVLHRQENLMQPKLIAHIVNKAIEVSQTQKVAFILHPITVNALVKHNLLKKLQNEKNIFLLDRADYFDFMKLLSNSLFVVTDGGSNQEELYYMGKPTLIIRTSTERMEGIDENAILYKEDMSTIDKFVKNFKQYEGNKIVATTSPTTIIANTLASELECL